MSLSTRESVARLAAAIRDAFTPSVSAVLASATSEIERLETVGAATRARAMRLYDISEEIERKASDALYEAERANRVARRFRELLD